MAKGEPMALFLGLLHFGADAVPWFDSSVSQGCSLRLELLRRAIDGFVLELRATNFKHQPIAFLPRF